MALFGGATTRKRGLGDLNAILASLPAEALGGVPGASPETPRGIRGNGAPPGIGGFQRRQAEPVGTGMFGRIPDLSRQGPGGTYGTPGFGDEVSVAGGPIRDPGALDPSIDAARVSNPGAVDMTGSYDVGKIKKPGLLGMDKHDWKNAAGVLSNMLLSMSANMGHQGSAMILQNGLQGRRERDQSLLRVMLETAERKRKELDPQQVGSNLIQADGRGGYKTLYSAPTPAENYASALGFDPGSPEYLGAIEDYALKSWGGTAFGRKSELQGERLDQSNTNNVRSTSTSRENNIRTTGTSSANNVRSTQQSNVNSVRAAGQSNVNSVRSTATTQRGQDLAPRRGRAAGNSARIVNPTTGEAMVLRNGQWVKE